GRAKAPPLQEERLRPSSELASLGMNPDPPPFLYEKGPANLHNRFEERGLGGAAARGVAAHAGLSGLDRQLDIRRKPHADWHTVVLEDLDDDVVHEHQAIVADDVRSERERLERLLVQEVIAIATGVEV